MIKYLLYTCLMLTLWSCTHLEPEQKQVHKILSQYTKQQEKQRSLEMVGTGSSMPNKVKGFHVRFLSHEKLDRPAARRLLLDCSEDLLAMINQDEAIRPYLDTYPFTLKGIDLVIGFINEDDEFRTPPYVAIVCTADEYLGFCDWDPIGKTLINEYLEDLADP